MHLNILCNFHYAHFLTFFLHSSPLLAMLSIPELYFGIMREEMLVTCCSDIRLDRLRRKPGISDNGFECLLKLISFYSEEALCLFPSLDEVLH
jgi:hypothetical protein